MTPSRKITKDFIRLLKKLGKKDQRIGQIFDNLNRIIEKDGKNMFYMENNELIEYLKKLYKEDL